MKDFIKNLANLIKVKTFVTLVVLGIFAFLSIKGAIDPDRVMDVVMMVIAFYFGTQHKKNTV